MKVCDSKFCVGCGACADACPKHCIEIRFDSEGFLKSYVETSRCVDCGKCKRVCPANGQCEKNDIQKVYKAIRHPVHEAKESTSGGIAALMAETIVQSGGVAYGAAWNEGLQVQHQCAHTVQQTHAFRGSKYLSSDVHGCYTEIKKQLEAGIEVLFTGTPCQNAALKKFLAKDYAHLYLVDFVCHGVSSRAAFDAYIRYMESCAGSKAEKVFFRNKSRGYDNSSLEILFENNTSKSHGSYDYAIGLWFAAGLTIGTSCYRCAYATKSRVTDVTLADFVGEMTEDDRVNGASAAFVNTSKGQQLLDRLDMDCMQGALEDTLKKHTRLNGYSSMPACRQRFFKDLQTKDFSYMLKKYTLKKILPNKLVLYMRAAKRRLLGK